MEARTRENYSYYLDRYILPWFGAMRMVEVMPADDEHGLGDDDLLFAMPGLPARPAVRAVADPAALGLTRPNESGRHYRHGTLSAYAAGRCRCEHCRGA